MRAAQVWFAGYSVTDHYAQLSSAEKELHSPFILTRQTHIKAADREKLLHWLLRIVLEQVFDTHQVN